MPQATKPGLSGVAEPLLITLYIWATESQRPDALIKDKRAEALARQLDPETLRKTLALTEGTGRLVLILKSREFDRFARDFLRRYPDAVVIHLGCSLDTRFECVDNGQLEWYDLDLPEVIFYDARQSVTAALPAAIKGFAGAAGCVEGIVRRIDRVEDGDQIQLGEILVFCKKATNRDALG